MSDQRIGATASGRDRAGLCGSCRHAHRIESLRGSTFWRCRLSETDSRFARYPALPVLACAGHAPMEPVPPVRPSGVPT